MLYVLGTKYATEYPCNAGYYSNRTSNVRWEVCEECFEGHYCPQGSSTPKACPKGRYRVNKIGKKVRWDSFVNNIVNVSFPSFVNHYIKMLLISLISYDIKWNFSVAILHPLVKIYYEETKQQGWT